MKKKNIINLVYITLFNEFIELEIKGNSKYIKKYALKYQSLLIPIGKNDKIKFFKLRNDFLYK